MQLLRSVLLGTLAMAGLAANAATPLVEACGAGPGASAKNRVSVAEYPSVYSPPALPARSPAGIASFVTPGT